MAQSGMLMLIISCIPLVFSATCKKSISSALERRYEINMGYGSLKLLKTRSIAECAIMCMSFRECGVINYNDGNNLCELLEASIGRPSLLSPPATPTTSIDWLTYSMKARYPGDGLCSVLSNGGFEETKNWTSVGTGYTYSTSDFLVGSRSLAVSANGAAIQSVTFKNGTTSFTVAAWSKSTGVGSPSASNFYGIATDVTLDDGSSFSIQAVRFPDVNAVWQQQVKRIDAPAGRTMTSARLILSLDNYGSGTVFFDNVLVANGDLTCAAVTGDSSRLCVPYFLPDPSFETGSADWEPHGILGFTYTTEDGHTWSRSIKVVNGGASYFFKFPPETYVHTLTIQAYSKPSGVTRPPNQHYTLHCDIHRVDGSFVYHNMKQYPVSGSEWTLKTETITVTKDTDSISCHLLYRRFPSGHVYFDDVKVFVDGMSCM